jgi:hypothetical protein
VASVEAAVLEELDPLAIVLPVLRGDVVTALADFAGEGDLDSLLVLGHAVLRFPESGCVVSIWLVLIW